MQRVNIRCQDCGHRGLLAFCPVCRGRRGGQQVTPAKLRQLKAAAKASARAKKAAARKAKAR